jgi:hypothetical protein
MISVELSRYEKVATPVTDDKFLKCFRRKMDSNESYIMQKYDDKQCFLEKRHFLQKIVENRRKL